MRIGTPTQDVRNFASGTDLEHHDRKRSNLLSDRQFLPETARSGVCGRGVTMERTRQGTKAGSRDKEFPTEWTLIDDAVSVQEEPQEEKSDSEETTGTMKAPLAARSHA